jgi:hypothetical protein
MRSPATRIGLKPLRSRIASVAIASLNKARRVPHSGRVWREAAVLRAAPEFTASFGKLLIYISGTYSSHSCGAFMANLASVLVAIHGKHEEHTLSPILLIRPLVHPGTYCLVEELRILRLLRILSFVGEIKHLGRHAEHLQRSEELEAL